MSNTFNVKPYRIRFCRYRFVQKKSIRRYADTLMLINLKNIYLCWKKKFNYLKLRGNCLLKSFKIIIILKGEKKKSFDECPVLPKKEKNPNILLWKAKPLDFKIIKILTFWFWRMSSTALESNFHRMLNSSIPKCHPINRGALPSTKNYYLWSNGIFCFGPINNWRIATV